MECTFKVKINKLRARFPHAADSAVLLHCSFVLCSSLEVFILWGLSFLKACHSLWNFICKWCHCHRTVVAFILGFYLLIDFHVGIPSIKGIIHRGISFVIGFIYHECGGRSLHIYGMCYNCLFQLTKDGENKTKKKVGKKKTKLGGETAEIFKKKKLTAKRQRKTEDNVKNGDLTDKKSTSARNITGRDGKKKPKIVRNVLIYWC